MKLNQIMSYFIQDLINHQIIFASQLHSYHASQLRQKNDREHGGDDHETEIVTIQTRQYFDVKLKKTNNFLKINSLNLKIGSAWNNLTFKIKESRFKTVNTFIKHVKDLYLSQYRINCTIPNCYICSL